MHTAVSYCGIIKCMFFLSKLLCQNFISQLDVFSHADGGAGSKAAKPSQQSQNSRHCGNWVRNTDGGTFSSPNYPNTYPPNKECLYVLEGNQHHILRLMILMRGGICVICYVCKTTENSILSLPSVMASLHGSYKLLTNYAILYFLVSKPISDQVNMCSVEVFPLWLLLEHEALAGDDFFTVVLSHYLMLQKEYQTLLSSCVSLSL